MKVAVIGIGGTGSAALRFLSKAGHEAIGFEQFHLGHDRGSSHGESRIIRYAYPDAFYTGLMRDAYPLWEALEADAGEPLFMRCGGLAIGSAENADHDAIAESLAVHGVPYEDLTPREARTRFPAFRLRSGERVLYQADAGFLRSTRCVVANARLAQAAGATIREGTAVQAIEPRGNGGVLVRTGAGEALPFDGAIVTAGSWMGTLLPRLGLPLTVTHQEVVYLRVAGASEPFLPDRFPIWIDVDTLTYGFPIDGRIDGVKIGWHHRGEVVDPDRPPRGPAEGAIRRVVAYAADRFPGLSSEATYAQTCLYTNTPDEDFILDQVPGAPIWLVSGCSGHGFKFTVLLGKMAAALAVGSAEAPARQDLARFALARFQHRPAP